MRTIDSGLKGMKVLIVDDTPANIDVLRKTMEETLDLDIAIALNGAVALEIASKFKPNLILLDIMMPVMNGFETCQKLKDDKTMKEIPVIFMTAMTEKKDVVKGFELGAEDYITKPFEPKEVIARIENQLVTQLLIEKLKNSNSELESFAYVVSHDLKAPLRAIKNLSDWIVEDLGDDLATEIAENISDMQSRVGRMENLIQGVLRYSRAGRGELNLEPCNLNKVLDEVLDFVVVPENFSIEIEPEMPELSADRTKLIQVFTNLMSNAIKHHNKSHGTIKVTTRNYERDENLIEIFLEDDGPGIPQEQSEKVFKMFHTLEARDDKENTGVGLTIVKKLVESQNGEISILYPAGGVGTTFRMLWPKGSE